MLRTMLRTVTISAVCKICLVYGSVGQLIYQAPPPPYSWPHTTSYTRPIICFGRSPLHPTRPRPPPPARATQVALPLSISAASDARQVTGLIDPAACECDGEDSICASCTDARVDAEPLYEGECCDKEGEGVLFLVHITQVFSGCFK